MSRLEYYVGMVLRPLAGRAKFATVLEVRKGKAVVQFDDGRTVWLSWNALDERFVPADA
ncbi:hypothetical protein [Demequina sp.]|uniref:hypothetical protein n=1 Tax=Demequina sp. TaxID=2050685 RepID=UPI003D0A15D6